jgi:asparagine synthase (glutamine-hydrolysing)
VANRLLRDKDANTVQKTFSSCFADKKYDEREYIATIVGITGVDAHYTFPSADTLFDLIDSIAFHQDEPYGSTSIYAQWHVFKLAAENGVRVMLDGQGGDEQLAGYHSFYGPFFATMVRKGKLGRLVHEIIAYCRLHNYSPYRAFRVMLGHMMPMSLSIPVKNKRDKSRIPSWLNWRGWAEEGVEPYFRKSLADRTYKSNPFNKLSYQQLVQAGLPMLLHWEDRASMAHSVESRVPFLDYRLVNFVFNLPAEYKIRKGYTKELLRRSMIGTLPETVRRRVDKMGFVTPEEIWLRGPLKEYFRHEIESITRSYKGFVQQKRLQDLLEDVITGKRGFDKTIWRLVSFHRWMKRFNVS